MAVNILLKKLVFHKNRENKIFDQDYHADFIKTLSAFSGKMMVKIFAAGILAANKVNGHTPKFRPEFIN